MNEVINSINPETLYYISATIFYIGSTIFALLSPKVGDLFFKIKTSVLRKIGTDIWKKIFDLCYYDKERVMNPSYTIPLGDGVDLSTPIGRYILLKKLNRKAYKYSKNNIRKSLSILGVKTKKDEDKLVVIGLKRKAFHSSVLFSFLNQYLGQDYNLNEINFRSYKHLFGIPIYPIKSYGIYLDSGVIGRHPYHYNDYYHYRDINASYKTALDGAQKDNSQNNHDNLKSDMKKSFRVEILIEAARVMLSKEFPTKSKLIKLLPQNFECSENKFFFMSGGDYYASIKSEDLCDIEIEFSHPEQEVIRKIKSKLFSKMRIFLREEVIEKNKRKIIRKLKYNSEIEDLESEFDKTLTNEFTIYMSNIEKKKKTIVEKLSIVEVLPQQV